MNNDPFTIDVDRLSQYLSAHIEGFQGPIEMDKFSGGQSNPTYLITTPNARYVLRRQPPGKLLKSAHAVDREYRVISALAETDVPVPTAYHLCTDTAVIGSMFYVMSFEAGRIFLDPTLAEIPKVQRAAYYEELIRILASLHSVDVHSVGLQDYGSAGNYYQRQIALWIKQYRAAEIERLEPMERLMEWLLGNTPVDDGEVSLVHGDFRLDNVMFAQDEAQGLAVLDWELSTLGHPLADLAYLCMCMRLPDAAGILGLGGKNLKDLGLPSEAELVALYCQLRGINNINNWHFYLAFAYFRLASIVQGVLKRSLDGNASSDKAKQVGSLAAPLAEMALSVISNEG